MQTATSTYLKFIPFEKLNLWDVKRYYTINNLQFENVVTLRDILKPYKKAVSKEEMIKNKWQIISKINFGGELFLRDFDEIKTYKGNLNLVPENAIIYSKINVRHGCIYYHEAGQTPFGVSSEYPTFKFDETKINGKFLHKVLRSNAFKTLLNTKTTGISKARVKQDEFLDIQIPLPTISDQNKIIENYYNKIALTDKLKQQIIDLEVEIDSYFTKQLGIEKKDKINKSKGIQIFEFKDFERWDVWIDKGNSYTNKFNTLKFGDIVLGKPIYGANVKGVKRKSETRYIRITDINENGTLNEEFVSPEFVDEKYLLKENDFLIARSGNTVGKTFLYKEKLGRAIYAGYLVNYHLDFKKVIPEYVLEYTKSYTFKQWILSNQRIAGQPNINGQEYLQAPIVIPPLNEQKKIIEMVLNLKNKILSISSSIEEVENNAQQEFENAIFS
ncbi:MAG: restriction endonuclease subunit S [Weeksellaceae bacterium]|nr:restriction endonuclease subunit S [Weeksellaceae bacterium]